MVGSGVAWVGRSPKAHLRFAIEPDGYVCT